MTPREAKYVIEFLKARNGLETTIKLTDGSVSNAINFTWGQDLGEVEHIYTNISPPHEGREMDFFLVSEIVEVLDENGARIFKSADLK
jgi:hypothetical protein